MIGYFIGLVLGILIFLLQNLKPTSVGFRILYLIMSIAFLWGMGYTGLGYWNILLLPLCEMVLCFICAVIFPYGLTSALQEYCVVSGVDYYSKLANDEKIGRIKAPGLKQTYDRILSGLISQAVRSQTDYNRLVKALYSNNFYPISEHTKLEIVNHLRSCFRETVQKASKKGDTQMRIEYKCERLLPDFFNAFVSLMSIHEEATRNIEQLAPKYDEN